MMLSKFDILCFNILCENSVDSTVEQLAPPIDPKFIDIDLAVVPGSFKPPHKGHWDMILEYTKLADIVQIFISNVSTKVISNRFLSKSNLQPVAKLISNFEDNKQQYTNTYAVDEFSNIFSDIIKASDTLTFNILKTKLLSIVTKINEFKTSEFDLLADDIEKVLADLNKKLFKSVRNTSNNIEIEPEISKQIFDIFIERYGLTGKVFATVSDGPSPMSAAVQFVNEQCKNCTIYLGCSNKGDDDTRWASFLKSFAKNQTNNIIEYPIKLKTNLSATELRNNISTLKKEWFPEKLTDTDFNKIKALLNND